MLSIKVLVLSTKSIPFIFSLKKYLAPLVPCLSGAFITRKFHYFSDFLRLCYPLNISQAINERVKLFFQHFWINYSYHIHRDLLAALESTEFSNLCNKLLENVRINPDEITRITGYQKPEKTTVNIIFDAFSCNSSKPYMMEEIAYPCYVMDNIEDRPKWDTYFISNGPRQSSVTLYKRLTQQQSQSVNSNSENFSVSPILLAENVRQEQLHNMYIVAFW